ICFFHAQNSLAHWLFSLARTLLSLARTLLSLARSLMASVNLQLIAVVNQDVQHVLNVSHERWLDAAELHVLFQNRGLRPGPENIENNLGRKQKKFVDLPLLPRSTYTVDAPGLYRVQMIPFAYDHAWVIFPNGNRVISGTVVHGGLTFNYTFAQSPDLQRRTIRRQQLYGNHTFVHYLVV
ncbi:hypothetical protein HID58_088306, partial [Brassica napus]